MRSNGTWTISQCIWLFVHVKDKITNCFLFWLKTENDIDGIFGQNDGHVVAIFQHI